MKPALFLTLCVVFSCFLAACETGKTSDEDLNLVTTDLLLELMVDAGESVVLIDVRKPEAYNAESIPGAINIPILQLRPNDPRLAEATQIVVYSDGWSRYQNDQLSWAAAKTMLQLGYKFVSDYRPGLNGWIDAGQPTIKSNTPTQDDQPVRS